LNREGHPDPPYTHLISSLGGGEFELLFEIINPISALEFQEL
jgi:hypothetical protein